MSYLISPKLACRVYEVVPQVQLDIINMLKQSSLNDPIIYGHYPYDGKKMDLAIMSRNRIPNSYGTGITISVDQIKTYNDRDEENKVVRYYENYEIQIIENKSDFNNHIIIFGPKNIDNKIYKAMDTWLSKSKETFPPPLRLIRVDLKSKIDEIMKAYPNLQHFCIKDILEDRTKDIVVKGTMLEETDLFERFVKDEYISGNVNFLGISVDGGKIVYVGSDGSVFSRFSFKGDEKIRIIYGLYVKFKKLNAITNSLEQVITTN